MKIRLKKCLCLILALFIQVTIPFTVFANTPTTEEKCTTKDNHSIACGNMNDWFDSKQELEEYYQSVADEWNKKYFDEKSITRDEFNKNSPCGYECYTCSYCGKWTGNFKYRDSSEGTEHTHSWDNGVVTIAPTCTSTGVKTYTCTVCYATYTESINMLEHKYVKTVTQPTCTSNGYTTYKCSSCGSSYTSDYIYATGHDFSKYSSNPNGTHNKICKKCGSEILENCTLVEKSGKYVCIYCKAEYEQKGCNHNWIATMSSTGTHREYCSKCGLQQDVKCNYLTIVYEPTCTQDGYTLYMCEGCGYTFTDNYKQATGHSYKYVSNNDGTHYQQCVNCETRTANETCTKIIQNGYYVCSKCKALYEKVPSEPSTSNPTTSHTHNWNDGVITKKATCTTDGIKTYTCSGCNETKTEKIKATGHKVVKDKAVSATCTKTGKTEGSHCSVCNTVITAQKTVAKKAHTYKNYVTKATTSKNGSIVSKCSVCGSKKSTSTIYKIKSVALSTTSTYYNGKVKTPSVTVKDSKNKTLKKGTDYTVSFASGRKNVGRYSVKVTFKGNYSGSKTLYFNIIPKNVTGIKKLTAGKKRFTVSWNPQKTQVTGYQIQYSTASNFKNAKTITMGKSSYSAKKVTGRLAKKRYYVRIRTYKTTKFNGKNYNIYSYWSAKKSVVTKR